MSAEQQTPDIETALTEAEVNALGPFIWGGWLGVDPEKHSDYAHELLELVGHIKADALAAAVREAEQRVASAFVEWAMKNEIAEPPLDWAWFGEITRRYWPHHPEYRADRVAEPQHEAATSGKESEASDE